MKNRSETIRKIVTYLNDPDADGGGIWLPNIQRNFVWSEIQIERLFDSIMREYPIGTLLIWKTKNNVRKRKFIDDYQKETRLSTYFVVVEDRRKKMLVLDGQQRLQSMFIGLMGTYERKELYFYILSGEPAHPDDIRFRFKFLNNSDIPPGYIKFKEIVLSDKRYSQISKDIISQLGETISEREKQRIEDNVGLIVKVFNSDSTVVYQEIDSIDEELKYSEEDIVEIFIRANSGGTPLGKSDLMFSLLTVSWEESNEKLEELIDELNKTGFVFTRDFILKTCLTLLDKGAAYNIEKFRLESTRDEIVQKWDAISDAIKDVEDFVYGKTYIRTDRALPSYLALIPMIYFRYHFKDKWNTTQKLDEYLIRSLMAGAFGGTPDNLIDKIVKYIQKEQRFTTEDIFGIIRRDGRSLELDEESILRNHYGSKNVHLFFNFWYKDFNYHPSFENNLPQVDHIFPQSKLKQIKEVNPTTNRRDLLKYRKEERDQFANLMLLTQEENGAGGKCDTLPEIWFADKSPEYLEKHLIPQNPELWKMDKYPEFIEERKKLILRKFEGLILK